MSLVSGVARPSRPVFMIAALLAADQDPFFRDIFYLQLLPELKAKGKTVVVISHDDRYYSLGDRIIKLDYGQIEFDREVTAGQLAEMKVTPHFYPNTVASS